MASKIRILDDQTINQIAAGEVIENPASVVKELVENAVDAGADEIALEVEGSGHQLIRIQDNGCGMSREEVLLSLQRHATSKLRNFSDIFSLKTMGFRGEALPSIASVSEMIIHTAENSSKSSSLLPAIIVRVRGGAIISVDETQGLAGTTIEVRSLFYNTPARKKFQKSPSRDAQDIVRTVGQLALAHPEVAFRLIINGKSELSCERMSFESYSERLRVILGKAISEKMKMVKKSSRGIELFGMFHDESASFPNRSQQYLFVNKRPVTSISLSFAVKNAYGPILEQNRHPSFVLHLTFPDDSVDVNVHPQKKEVRFKQEDMVRQLVQEAVSQCLLSDMSLPNPFSANLSLKNPSFTAYALNSRATDPLAFTKRDKEPHVEPFPTLFTDSVNPQSGIDTFDYTIFQLLGAFKEYVLFRAEWNERCKKKLPETLLGDGIMLLHLKRALMRIAYDDLVKGQQNHKNFVHAQSLLIPVFVELSTSASQFLLKLIPSLKNAGLLISEFGRNCFLIESVPPTLSHLDSEELKDFLLQLAESASGDSFDLNREARKVAELATRKYKIQSPLGEEFTKKVLDRLFASDNPSRCPFGNPIFAHFSELELENKFI